MTGNRASLRLVAMAVLALLLAGLGCSVCPFVPQPSPPTTSPPPPPPADTPTPRPTPTLVLTTTPATSVEMVPYTNPIAGFSVLYPEEWVYEAEVEGVFFAETTQGLETADPAEGLVCAFFAGIPGDIEYILGETTTADDLLDSLVAELCTEECEMGDSEPWFFGETQGAGREVSWLDSWAEVRVKGYMVAAVGDEVAGIGLGASPEQDWASYKPIVMDVFASLEFFPPEVPEPVERGAIRPGETVRGELPLGGKDIWTFGAQEGQYVTIQAEAIVAGDLDTYLELYDGDGAMLVEDDDGGEGTNSRVLDFRIDDSDTYYVHVSAYGGEGDYRLGLEIADEPSGGGQIEYGEAVRAMMSGGGEHTWEFSGGEGDEISIAMNTVEGELDCYLELYSSDEELLTYDDDSGGSLNSLIEYYVLPADGLYRIVASDLSGESGEYELTLEIAQLEIQGSLSPDQIVAATLEPASRHHWLFEGETGDIVTISMTALDTDLDAYLELFAPSGELVTMDDDSGADSNAAIVEFELAHTGTYRVVARAYNDEQAGKYELTLEMAQLAIEGTLAYDQAVTAVLKPGEHHHWLFEGTAGKVVSISIVAVDEDMDTYLELFAPNGERVMTDDDSGGDSNAAILMFELPLNGTYRVVARGYSDVDTGTYELILTRP